MSDYMQYKSVNFEYILRIAIAPENNENERFEHLLEFCKLAYIDEVMFFINCEELNQGHLTIEETKPWMEVIAKGKALLDHIGVKTSINPWSTLLHTDRGRKLKNGQDFMLMTDPYGNKTNAVACPLCPNWQNYIKEMYSYYASLKPNVVWVEDDFRLHNHEPLVWGGCFCDLHMEEYSKLAIKLGIKTEGDTLTREEFVKGIVKNGDVHPYRKVWLDVSRETMINIAKLLGEAVRKISPGTKVGLMSSSPSTHCAEGRDWNAIFKNLSGDSPPINRPHLPCYIEETPQSYLLGFSAVTRMTKAFLPESTLIYPELENFQNTRFAKSKAFTKYQIETSTLFGSHGITLNIFDMMGNGALLTEGYQYTLANTKYFVNCLTALGLNASKQQGIKIPICQESSYTLKTRKGDSMYELYPQETFWCQLLSAYGIANIYTRDIEHENSIIAVSGQYFRNLESKELVKLFINNYIIMEGSAAYTLWDMGFGYLAGIDNIICHEPDSGIQAYEEVCDGGIYSGLHNARMSNQIRTGPYLEIKYVCEKTAHIITVAKTPNGNIIGPGMVLYNNKVLILPYDVSGDIIGTHLNTTKQEIIQTYVNKLGSVVKPAMVLDAPYVSVYDYAVKDRRVLIVVNSSGDDLNEVKIKLADDIPLHAKILEINNSKSDAKNLVTVDENGVMIFKNLKRLELRAFVFVAGTY